MLNRESSIQVLAEVKTCFRMYTLDRGGLSTFLAFLLDTFSKLLTVVVLEC